MTAKRYCAHKHLLKENKVYDKICHRFMNISETVEHMNMYYQKYTALKKENKQLKQQIKDLRINVFDSIYEVDDIKCNCNPCVVEECVKKVIE